MDIYCPKCGEPWEIDSLHDVAGCRTFEEGRETFNRIGCNAFGAKHNEQPDANRAQASAMLADLMGDDVDGIAAMLEDAEYIGLFD